MKKIFVSTLFLFFVFASTTFAHTQLENSNPTDGQIVESNLSEITLQFDTTIESKSLLTLTNEAGEEIEVTTSVDDDTMIANITSSLENGTYEIDYNIIGEDGHPMSGSLLFMVNLSEAAEAENDSSEVGSSFNWALLIIGVVVLVIILALFTKPPKRRRF